MHLNIRHTTTYRFDAPVDYGLQQLRLTPKTSHGQSIGTWAMDVQGGVIDTSFTDHNQNACTLVSFTPGAQELRVVCEGAVNTQDLAGVIGRHGGFAPLWFFRRTTTLTTAGAHVMALTEGLNDDYAEDVPRLHALSARVIAAVSYEIGRTGAGTTAEGAMLEGAGVCQDHAHIFIAAARAMGYPARYVSGYLMMTDRVHQDATHAWAEIYVDGLGWVGFDVSNGYSPDPRYVRVATGLDYAEAAPVAGLYYGASSEAMSVDIEVAQQ
jgi:transglutaminase-like putative cysteine protease